MKRFVWKKKEASAEPAEKQKRVFMSEMKIKVLGSGCAKCNALEAAARQALEELGWDAEMDHVTDFVQIAAYGVMSTPALAVNDQVVCCGKVLKPEEVKKIFRECVDK